jgi:hypothetical protein
MKNKIGISLICISLVAVTSCETPLKVTSDYDKGVNFANYKTFALVSFNAKDQQVSELNVDRVIKAIKSEMTAKGFTEDTNAPDLKLNAVTIMTSKKEVTANTTNYGYGYGGVYRPYGWGGGVSSGYTTFDVNDYTDGSLIVEVIDAKTGKLIWEGVGNKEIDTPSKNPDKTIPEAVTKIMRNFPPGKK